MKKEFWDNRYRTEFFAYGRQPNRFFKAQIEQLSPGKLLLPAEGEGRNAVYAAMLGWDVTAFDISDAGKEKALKLAEEKKVSINYLISDYNSIQLDPAAFDLIALIYAHPPAGERRKMHRKLIPALKPGGSIVLEGFSKSQIQYDSGGPKVLDMLYSAEELLEDFEELDIIECREEIIFLEEGLFHKGQASVIRLRVNK